MDVEAHVRALDLEGRMLVEAARRTDLAAPVPTCPGWNVADLLAHIGYVHRWATGYVATAITEMVEEADEATVLTIAPPEEERCDWVADGHRELVEALRAAPRDLVCWTFLAAPSPLAMWARRQAHETAVHRVDAELAAGGTASPVEQGLGADGVDELLFGFFGRARRYRGLPPEPVTIDLEATDRAERWTVRLTPGGIEAGRGAAGPGGTAVVVRATASDLYLLLWHRRTLGGLDVDGPAQVFEEAWGPRGVTWA